MYCTCSHTKIRCTGSIQATAMQWHTWPADGCTMQWHTWPADGCTMWICCVCLQALYWSISWHVHSGIVEVKCSFCVCSSMVDSDLSSVCIMTGQDHSLYIKSILLLVPTTTFCLAAVLLWLCRLDRSWRPHWTRDWEQTFSGRCHSTGII